MKILNLTQHNATEDQIKDGVFEPTSGDKEVIKKLLTFNEIPDIDTLKDRAMKIANIAKKYGVNYAMIGGAPYFMSYLEFALNMENITPLYSFSKRVVEEVEKNGVVEKKVIFKHIGWVE